MNRYGDEDFTEEDAKAEEFYGMTEEEQEEWEEDQRERILAMEESDNSNFW